MPTVTERLRVRGQNVNSTDSRDCTASSFEKHHFAWYNKLCVWEDFLRRRILSDMQGFYLLKQRSKNNLNVTGIGLNSPHGIQDQLLVTANTGRNWVPACRNFSHLESKGAVSLQEDSMLEIKGNSVLRNCRSEENEALYVPRIFSDVYENLELSLEPIEEHDGKKKQVRFCDATFQDKINPTNKNVNNNMTNDKLDLQVRTLSKKDSEVSTNVALKRGILKFNSLPDYLNYNSQEIINKPISGKPQFLLTAKRFLPKANHKNNLINILDNRTTNAKLTKRKQKPTNLMLSKRRPNLLKKEDNKQKYVNFAFVPEKEIVTSSLQTCVNEADSVFVN